MMSPFRTTAGFTLIEMLVVIAIIGMLASMVVASVSDARTSAQYTVARADITKIAQLIEFVRYETNDTLLNITGSFCTECSCRDAGNQPPAASIRETYDTTDACYTDYFDLIALLNTRAGGIFRIENPPLDPWGAPYLINENEGEGGNCDYDNITSAGPNGRYYDTDDVTYNVPITFCAPASFHHVNTNWY